MQFRACVFQRPSIQRRSRRKSNDDGVTSCQCVLQSAGCKPFTGTPPSSYRSSGAELKGSVDAGVTVVATPKCSRAQWENNSRVWRKTRMHQVTLLPLDREHALASPKSQRERKRAVFRTILAEQRVSASLTMSTQHYCALLALGSDRMLPGQPS